MSYNNGSGRNDYRGRGKRASERHKGKHYKPRGGDEAEILVPIGDTAVEARLGKHERSQEPAREKDPFAPSEDYRPDGGAGSTAEPTTADFPAAPASEKPLAPEMASDREEPSHQGPEDALRPASEPEPENGNGADAIDADAGSEEREDDAPASPTSGEAARYSRGDAHYTKHKTRFSRGQKIAVAVVALVAAIVFAAAGVALAFWHNTQSNIQLADQTIKDELTPTVSNADPYWVLVMGSDSRTTDTSGTRSDVIMLVRVDEPNKQISLVSIPRDTYVTINGSHEKINAAYSYGGAKQMIRTVQDFSGVKVSHYAEVYFKGFKDLVDEIGGVDVVVPETGSYNGITIEKGKQHLDGREALTFARIRKSYATGDFRRTECQRILVQALAKKILSQDITEIPGTIAAASECFSTDMPLADIVNIAMYMKGMDTDDMYSAMTPSTTGMLGGVSYTFTYNYQWILMMQKAANGENPKLTKREQEICGTESTETTELDMEAGLPETIQGQLQDYWDEREAKREAKEKARASKDGSSTASESSGSSSTAEDKSTAASESSN